jgi:hypothetical protein
LPALGSQLGQMWRVPASAAWGPGYRLPAGIAAQAPAEAQLFS